MKTTLKNVISWRLILGLLFLTPAMAAVSENHETVVVTCPSPDVVKTGQTANSASFSWDPVSGATQYAVWCVRKSDGANSGITYTSNTNHTFPGLSSGEYTFYFATVCSDGLSNIIIVTDVVM